MYVKFVPIGSRESKHVKIQVESEESIVSLREKVGKQLKVDHFNLLHHGRKITDESQNLSFYKMTPSSTIHVIESLPPTTDALAPESPPPSEDKIQEFMFAFGLAIKNSTFHKVAQRLCQRQNLENFVATCSGLANDPVACAFLTKPELLYSLLDPETLKYCMEKHPGLIDAANQIAAAVYEEEKSNNKSATSSTAMEESEAPNPFAYNLDEMSDDDDEEMETGEVQRGARRSIGEGNPITADQLAMALRSAQNALGIQPSASTSAMGGMTGFTTARPSQPSLQMPNASEMMSGPSTSRTTPGSATGITQADLAAALAMAISPQAAAAAASASRGPQNPAQQFASQLKTMKELGLQDEAVCIKALQVMGGDVQAAIDLIYSGWSGDDDSAN